MHLLTGLALAIPWLAAPIVTAIRLSRSRSLDEESSAPPADEPLVSLIVPARDEEHNIERCLRSALAARYPRLEVILVDDHSRDATAAIAERIAASDSRLRIVRALDLPAGWFGKPWACLTGAGAARGEIFLFMDADTTQSADLVTRIVNAMRSRNAGMVSVAGTQEMHTFWETLLQPQVFSVLLMRYGGTESVNRSRRAWDKIANGQCIAIRRDAYEAIGGHAAVRDRVAEDLMIAQRLFLAGTTTALVMGVDQLSTRMYASLGELVRGWRKNVFAGGIDALPPSRILRIFFPLSLLAPPLAELAPPVVLALRAVGIASLSAGALAWAGAATAALLAWWLTFYTRARRSPAWALLFPLGAAVLLWIFVGAIMRGRRVAWKGRSYRAA
ncbi:MAG TPA: glycosyltransferase family 2 protein [Gemmatimonadaceae bacterium]|nr:glycosyltransferase family 2 protein [Gemmatimonadaceae bacterium]